MMKRILLLFLLTVSLNVAKSQVLINEVAYTLNGSANADFWGQYSDYIELYNATPGLPINMANYYLTNDKTNLYKWKIPSTITIPPLGYLVVRCSGRNTKEPGATGLYHTNFDIEQCKNQWIMLTYQGAVKDSLYVRRTKPGDNWGRYPDASVTPINLDWKLINGASNLPLSFALTNTLYPIGSVYIGYAPIPTFSTQAGFTTPASGQYDLIISPSNLGVINDTVNFQINYTQGMCSQIGGQIPCTSYTGCIGTTTSATTYTYLDGVTTPITMPGITNVITAITIPKGTYSLSFLPSFAETNTYFEGADVNVSNGFGVLSAVMDTSFFTSLAPAATIHVEYFDKNKFYSEGGGAAIQPPNDSWANQQRGFDVGFDDRSGFGCSLKGDIFNDATFGVSTRTVYPNFEVRASGKDNFSMVTPTVSGAPPIRGAHMRDAFAQTYAMKNNLNLDGMHYKPIRTFINGCYWGIYEFREIPDADYLNYYFGVPKDSMDILRQHLVGSIYNATTGGSDTGWVTTPMTPVSSANNAGLFNYVKTYPMISPPPNKFYDNVMSRLSQRSFMDYFIYNSYLVNTDLTSLNTSWWRKRNPGGTIAPISNSDTITKWRYFMWDMNNILGLRINSTYTTSATQPMMTSPCVLTSTLLLPSVNPLTFTTTTSTYTGHNYMLYLLNQNPKFKNEYLNRYMDLLNTTLRCDKMLAHFTYFRNMFTPEMTNHTAAWGLNQPDWDFNMDTLRIRILERCTKIDSLISKSNCSNLSGPYDINIDVKPMGAGTVDFNSLHLNSFIWSGQYFQKKYPGPYLSSFMEAYATDTSLYVFDHWEFTSTTNSTTVLPYVKNSTGYLSEDSISFEIKESDNITAVFADKRTDVLFPTGFTPNGDGFNDVFSPLGAAAKYSKDYELRVWNRWGQEVFRSGEYSLGWDGNQNGQQAQTGVYAYMLTYKNVIGENKIIKGNVTLIR